MMIMGAGGRWWGLLVYDDAWLSCMLIMVYTDDFVVMNYHEVCW